MRTGERTREYVEAAAAVAVAAAVCLPFRARLTAIDVAMLHLLAVVFVASRSRRGPAILASLLAIAVFDFFFVPPYGTFVVRDATYLPTFAVMLLVALVMSRLTARSRELAERHEATRAAMDAEHLRTTLLSSLSHDLRTPLASIEGAGTALLADPELPAETRRELGETIVEESRRMGRLVANLLDMVRVETGTLAVQRAWVPVEEIVGVALLRLDGRLGAHPVRVTLPPELPLLRVDELLMEQVLVNLLENAARHTPAGTPVDISAWVGDGTVTMEVADRGPGIPPGEEELVFRKFYRARPAATTVTALSVAGGGAGLGLAICRGIVTAHGGSIGVVRREGGGAAFRITLPLDTPQPAPPPAEPDPGAGAPGRE